MVMLGLTLFLWDVRRGEGPFRDLLRLGGKLGIKSEGDGPHLLMRGLFNLLTYEAAHETIKRALPAVLPHPSQEDTYG